MAELELIKNPVKAIRAYCLGCCNGSPHEVNLCPATDCELYPFRFGKNPYRSKRSGAPLTEERIAKMLEARKKKQEGIIEVDE